MARDAGIDPKKFRRALRREIKWHKRYARWTVDIDTAEHTAMQRILRRISN
jgi:hypothetical protein